MPEPADPAPVFDGRHLWVYWAAFRTDEPARTSPSLAASDMLVLVPPGCYWCEQLWRPDIGVHCSGVTDGG